MYKRQELKNIVTSGNGLSLSDKERMDVVDQIYTRMLRYRNLTRYYTCLLYTSTTACILLAAAAAAAALFIRRAAIHRRRSHRAGTCLLYTSRCV